jgi:hypothetical protein
MNIQSREYLTSLKKIVLLSLILYMYCIVVFIHFRKLNFRFCYALMYFYKFYLFKKQLVTI